MYWPDFYNDLAYFKLVTLAHIMIHQNSKQGT